MTKQEYNFQQEYVQITIMYVCTHKRAKFFPVLVAIGASLSSCVRILLCLPQTNLC